MANTKARVAQAAAQFEKAKVDFERNKKLWEQQVISDSDWESIQATFKVNEAELTAAQESLKGTEYQVKTLKPPCANRAKT